MTSDDPDTVARNAPSRPVVSIIMAVHAGANPEHMRAAIGSILRQTWEPLELLIVQDGPVTSALEAGIGAAQDHDARVRLVKLDENRGPGAARNAGISESAGDYIAVLDADDLAEPERLERQIAFLGKNHADLVGSDYRLIDETGAPVGIKRLPVTAEGIRKSAVYFNPIGNSTVLARRDVFTAFPYREDLRYGEDYDLWIRMLRADKRLLNLPEPLVQFRVPTGFLARRRGVRPFRSDLGNKLAALALYPRWQRPLLLPVAVVIASARLLPAAVLSPVYWLGRRVMR